MQEFQAVLQSFWHCSVPSNLVPPSTNFTMKTEYLYKCEVDSVLVFTCSQTPERMNQTLTESKWIQLKKDNQKCQPRHHVCVAGPADWKLFDRKATNGRNPKSRAISLQDVNVFRILKATLNMLEPAVIPYKLMKPHVAGDRDRDHLKSLK